MDQMRMDEQIISQDQITQYLQYSSGAWKHNVGDVIVEKPVSLTVNGEV